jgi:hypothetical protein
VAGNVAIAVQAIRLPLLASNCRTNGEEEGASSHLLAVDGAGEPQVFLNLDLRDIFKLGKLTASSTSIALDA